MRSYHDEDWCVLFPIDNRHFIAADDFCQINLSESQIESPFANGLAERFGIAGISSYLGEPLSGCRLTAADVNGDNTVNTVDVIAIQRFFLGSLTGIANVGKYQFNPANRTYPGIIIDQTGQNYDTLIFGDVASPYVH